MEGCAIKSPSPKSQDTCLLPYSTPSIRPPQPVFANKAGIGVELEFFILDRHGALLNALDGQNTAALIINALREQYPKLSEKIWCEESAAHMEAISGVHTNIVNAIRECMRIVDAANDIANRHGGQAVLIPVPAKPFTFIPSPNPRATALLRDPSWQAKAKYTAIASTQINTSYLFNDCKTEDERWNRALAIMQSLTPEVVANMTSHDSQWTNYEGLSRLQILRTLIPGESKWRAFQALGFTNPAHVLFPERFRDLQHFQCWLKAHGKLKVDGNVADVPDKDVHAGVCKIKRGIGIDRKPTDAPWMAEFRIMGSAGSNVTEVTRHLEPVSDHIETLKRQFSI